MRTIRNIVLAVENRMHAFFVRRSIGTLRVSIGAVFLAFGVLKYFPGVSPAQGLATATTDILFFGRVPGSVAILLIATLECAIGLLLIIGRGLRLAVYLLLGELVGILSPVLLLSARLFAGPHHAPTLEGQYMLKDVILVAAAMVVTAGSFRGGRLVRADPTPVPVPLLGGDRRADAHGRVEAREKLDVVLSTIGGSRSIDEVCQERGISPDIYHLARDGSERRHRRPAGTCDTDERRPPSLRKVRRCPEADGARLCVKHAR